MKSSIIPNGFRSTAHKIFLSDEASSIISKIDENRNKNSKTSNHNTNDSEDIQDNNNELQLSIKGSDSITKKKRKKRKLIEENNEQEDSNSSSSSNLDYNCCCYICLDKIFDPVTLLVCHHQYCFQCLFAWLKIKDTCPVCKSNVKAFVRNVSHSNDKSLSQEVWKRSNTDMLQVDNAVLYHQTHAE